MKVSEKKISQYVNPNEWNNLISDQNVTLIDIRKPFEYKVGTFKGSINPKIYSFREFPRYLNKLEKSKKVAMP